MCCERRTRYVIHMLIRSEFNEILILLKWNGKSCKCCTLVTCIRENPSKRVPAGSGQRSTGRCRWLGNAERNLQAVRLAKHCPLLWLRVTRALLGCIAPTRYCQVAVSIQSIQNSCGRQVIPKRKAPCRNGKALESSARADQLV